MKEKSTYNKLNIPYREKIGMNDYKLMAEMSRELKFNIGKGYTAYTIRECLKKNTKRKNLQIEELFKIYLEAKEDMLNDFIQNIRNQYLARNFVSATG